MFFITIYEQDLKLDLLRSLTIPGNQGSPGSRSGGLRNPLDMQFFLPVACAE
jgi:hypothetical protein